MGDTGALVYVVDDDASAREGVARLIRSAGLMTKTFVSGEEFLAAARPPIPRCVVLDVNLPGLSGLDLQQELAKSGLQVSIIFLTGHGDIPMTVRALKAGAANFFTKPLNDEDLLNAIQQCISSQSWYGTATEIESRKQDEERVRKEHVRLEERTRIAQELHDTLLQSFLGASLQLGAALNSVPSDSLVKPQLDRILELMRQGIEDGRKTLQGLRLSDSRALDLVPTFSRAQQELAVQPDVDFRVTVTGRQQPVWPPIQHEIYRIGREALVNAFFHSGAKCVEFELEYADSDLRLRVRDNGCGIDPQVLDSGRAGHWGLAGMRERATRIGALLKISSTAAAGTEVELSVPSQIAFAH
jgi:signal transduction histidine kinase